MTAYPITVDQLLALEQQGYFVPPPSGYVFYAVVDTAADIKSLTPADIDTIGNGPFDLAPVSYTATDTALDLSVAQMLAFEAAAQTLSNNGVSFTFAAPPGDPVSVADSGAQLATLTTADFDALAAFGIMQVVATSGADPVSVSYYLDNLMGQSVAPPSPYSVYTISDIAANIEKLTASDIAAMQAAGVYGITVTDGSVALSYDQAAALVTALQTVSVGQGDTITVADEAANIENLTPAQIDALTYVSNYTSTSGSVVLSAAQALALEATDKTVSASGGTVSVADTFADMLNVTAAQAQGFAAVGISSINVVDDGYNFFDYGAGAVQQLSFVKTYTSIAGSVYLTSSLAQAFEANGAVVYAPGWSVVYTDSIADYEAFSPSQFTALDSIGVTSFQVYDLAADIQALTPDQIILDLPYVDFYQVSDSGSVVLDAAQAAAFGEVGASLSGGPTGSVSVVDNVADFESLSEIATQGIRTIGVPVTVEDSAFNIENVFVSDDQRAWSRHL